jgi:hypothetical protein
MVENGILILIWLGLWCLWIFKDMAPKKFCFIHKDRVLNKLKVTFSNIMGF